MTEIELNTKKLLDLIADKFVTDNIDNNSLVQIIELCGGFLNVRTISKYASENKMSYNGVKKFRNIINLFGMKLVIDNA